MNCLINRGTLCEDFKTSYMLVLSRKNKLAQLNFIKEDEKWYIDYPSYPFSKANLQMVAGADVLLESLANGLSKISIQIEYGNDKKSINKSLSYQRTSFGYGADYKSIYNEDIKEFWLCPVTLYVLQCYPKYIHINI